MSVIPFFLIADTLSLSFSPKFRLLIFKINYLSTVEECVFSDSNGQVAPVTFFTLSDSLLTFQLKLHSVQRSNLVCLVLHAAHLVAQAGHYEFFLLLCSLTQVYAIFLSNVPNVE